MRIRFNGIIEQRSSGCKPCGRAKTEKGFSSFKDYFLPSGITKRFYRGRIEEVNDEDGEFLLDYKYEVGGKTKNAFEVVNG